MVLLDTGTPGTSREIFSEDADDGTRTRNHSVCNRGVASSSPIIGILRKIYVSHVKFLAMWFPWSKGPLSLLSFVVRQNFRPDIIRRYYSWFPELVTYLFVLRLHSLLCTVHKIEKLNHVY